MKISILQYAKALLELTDEKSEQEVSDTVKGFARQLEKNGQMKNAGRIMEKFSEIYDAKHGIVKAEIVSREKISSEMADKIKVFIKEKYSADEVIIENVVDENIRGGITMKVGNEILDASISAQLKRLKSVLSK